MHFAGRLHLHDDSGPGLAVDLQIDEGTLSLTSGAEGLGSWHAGEVTATRITGDRFAMSLAGEEVVFVANDPLGFTYEGLPSLEDAQNQRKPGMLSRAWASWRSQRAGEDERGAAPARLASSAAATPQTARQDLPVPTPEVAVPTSEIQVPAPEVPVATPPVAARGEPRPAQAEQAKAAVSRPSVIEIVHASPSQPATPMATRQQAKPSSTEGSTRQEGPPPPKPDYTPPPTLSADPWARPDPQQTANPPRSAAPATPVPGRAVPETVAGAQATEAQAATRRASPPLQSAPAAASSVQPAAPSGAAPRAGSAAGLGDIPPPQKATSPATGAQTATDRFVKRTAQPSLQPQEERRCPAVRTDGRPCQSTILGPSGYCFSHDPELDEERREARRRGGLSTGRLTRLLKVPPAALAELYERLERAIVEVHEGRLEPARATAMASLVQALCATLELGDARRRLEDLAAGLHDSSGKPEAS